MKSIFSRLANDFKQFLPLYLIFFSLFYVTLSTWQEDWLKQPFSELIPYAALETMILTIMLLPVARAWINIGSKTLNILAFLIGNLTLAAFVYEAFSEPSLVSDSTSYTLTEAFLFATFLVSIVLFITTTLLLYLRTIKLIFAKYLKGNLETVIVLGAIVLLFDVLPTGAQQYSSYQLEKQNMADLLDRITRIEKHMGGEKVLNCDQAETVSNVSKSIVRVVGVFSEGSGVVIYNNGTIITNYHVVAGEPAPKIVFSDYSKYPATYIGVDKHLDLAVLKIDKQTPDYLTFGETAPFTLSPLTPVYSFGFPLGTDIVGGVTVQEGKFVSMRTMEGVDYLHTDLSLQQGQSGGALTDVCGNLLGLNQSSLAGASFSISNIDLFTSVISLIRSDFDETDIDIIEFKENESALEAVRAFYNYQVIHQLEKSYNLLAKSYLDGRSFEKWSQGYENVVGIDLIRIEEEDEKSNTIYVKFVSTDLEGSSKIRRYFEGTWKTEKIDGEWKLIKPNIKQVEDPEWRWFYE
jgi:S1-C subfamily serine protease